MTLADRIITRAGMAIPIGAVILSFASTILGQDIAGQMMFYLLFPGSAILFASVWGIWLMDRALSRLPRSNRRRRPLVTNSLAYMTLMWFPGPFGAVAFIAIFGGIGAAIASGESSPLLYPALPGALVLGVLVFIWRKSKNGLVRGLVLRAKGQYEEAREAFLEFERQQPDNALALDGATFIRLLFHEELDAVATAQHGVDTKSKLLPKLMRGQALAQLGASDEALADLFETYSTRKLPTVAVFLAHTLIDQRRLVSAIHYLEQHAWNANSPCGLLFLADAYRLSGFNEDAVATYRDVEDVARRMLPAALPELALAQARRGDLENAEQSAREHLRRLARDTEALTALLIVHAQRGETEDALRIAQEIASVSPHAAVRALQDPDLSPLLTNPRFRELFVSSVRERRLRVAEAIRIIEGFRLAS